MPYTATIEEENKEIASRYKDLLKGTYEILSVTDKKLIRKAFEIAVDAHSNQRRKTGQIEETDLRSRQRTRRPLRRCQKK